MVPVNSTKLTSETENEISPENIFEAILLIFICLGTIIGNISLWIIICRNKDLQTVTNAFILGLTSADLTVAFLNMPVTVLALCFGDWPWSMELCTFFGYTNMLTLVTSVMSLCNVSINRYVMVCKPIYFKRIYTKRNACCMILVCVFTSSALSSPPLFGWAEYSYISLQYFCFCDWKKSKSYAFFMIITCFGIPFTVMTICNIFIFRTVRASKRRVANIPKVSIAITKNSEQENNTPSSPITASEKISKINDVTVIINDNTKLPQSTVVSNGKEKELPKRGKRRTEEVRLATALAIVVITFVICWLPYCISMLLEIFAEDEVHRSFHMATIILGYANSAINPVIYGVMNKKFGDGFKKLFCCLCKFCQ